MICLLHGYLLDGSGSNLWTRSMLRALCRAGEDVHLMCQEPHPERYDFIAEARVYGGDNGADGTGRHAEPGPSQGAADGYTITFSRDVPYPGRCIMHKPVLGATLPVYVWDEYEEFEHVIPMTELGDAALENYLHRNLRVLLHVIREHDITALHANHAVLMSVVAQRASSWTGVPYAIMPHGSAIEYAIKPDARLRRLGAEAFANAARTLVISDEVADRVEHVFRDDVADLGSKMMRLDLGVDTAAFVPIDAAARAYNVGRVKELVAPLPRGRTPAQAAALTNALDAGADVGAACAAVGEFTAKHPDADVETKLDSVDWSNAQVLAFVGRLIAAKGIHAVIGALPLVLAQAPRLRVIVVGHGPLRDPLEALLYAMQHGDRARAEQVLAHAESIAAGEPEHLDALRVFWQQLDAHGQLDEYWDAAQRYLRPDTVLFTGYLTHREMSQLLPCCDAAIFPSMVTEAGPLVFLEALASGVFPIGTYFGGMQVKIDKVAPSLQPGAEAAMKVRRDAGHIVADIAAAVPLALQHAPAHRHILRDVAEQHYDWQPLARRLSRLLHEMSAATPA
jgi:glycosyltransferase involved in cell wall biosynthesis